MVVSTRVSWLTPYQVGWVGVGGGGGGGGEKLVWCAGLSFFPISGGTAGRLQEAEGGEQAGGGGGLEAGEQARGHYLPIVVSSLTFEQSEEIREAVIINVPAPQPRVLKGSIETVTCLQIHWQSSPRHLKGEIYTWHTVCI